MADGGAYKIKLKKVEARMRTSLLHGGGGWGLVIKNRGREDVPSSWHVVVRYP